MEAIETDEVIQTTSPYSQAIKDDGHVYVSGQVGFDTEREIVGTDVQSQTRQALRNIERILEAAGTSLDNVVKTTAFLTDQAHFEEFNEVYREVMTEPYPARSAVIAGIVVDALKVEIDVVANA